MEPLVRQHADPVEHLLDRRADAGTQVDGGRGTAGTEVVDGGDVGLGQVVDVDVVANAGAVGRRIVVAEQLQSMSPSQGNPKDQGDQVRVSGLCPSSPCRPSGLAPAALK